MEAVIEVEAAPLPAPGNLASGALSKKTIVRVPLTDTSTATLIRPLGAFERMLHRHMEAHPMHFSLVAELAGVVEPARLRAALAAVQHRHPLLAAHVEDRPGTRLGFYRPAVVPPIPLTVLHAAAGHTWQQVAAEELGTRFDPSAAPLVRAVLLRESPVSATLVLSFDHTVADGLSAVFVLEDVLAVLNGHKLAVLPVPPAQEQLLARLPSTLVPAAATSPAEAAPAAPLDERLSALVPMRPFDGVAPDLSTITFDADLTSRLVQRCRAEGTTVHAALVAATTQVMSKMGQREVVRVFTPFNFRPLLGDVRDCADYFSATRTGFLPEQTQNLWELARLTGAQLAQARSEAGIRGISAAVEQFIPLDADHAAAAGFMAFGLSSEALISNLGVLDLPETGAVRPTAIWGPVLLTQFQHESVIGVATFRGELRLVCATHAPVPELLPLIRATLAAATAVPGSGAKNL
ncbi:condensation domain-containing protein [Hymenobacter sp. H14-R3]|uniref:condensation domain-containing protein n=1 Tax=Hymenobacter sp. H14-R3 TaxID=3046308 RepID=UPI0024BAA41B|nr:condensation domain-containing protein [Hymenobacter sp. H14-R3]MDJ0367711.1 condensation domain-containing protein [Hymenobacter sp. H14-R3]